MIPAFIQEICGETCTLRSKTVAFSDRRFIVHRGVYEPAEDTFLIAENLQLQSADNVLDVGTGCGILAVLSALQTEHVLAVDINPYATRCAKLNAQVNDVSGKVAVIRGDLFGPLRRKPSFDVVLFNAPYLPAEKEEIKRWVDRAWHGGETGRQVIDRFIEQASAYLKCGGRVLLVQSTLSDVEKTLLNLEEHGFTAEIMDRCAAEFETITLIQATKKGKPVDMCLEALNRRRDK